MFSRSFLAKAKRKTARSDPKSDQHAKATPFALPRPRNPLLDEATTEVRINQPSCGPLDCIGQAEITDAVLSRELRQGPRFENTHIRFSSSKNYSL